MTTQDRIYTHSNNGELHKYISPDVLPKKLGGKIEKFDNSECYDSLMKFDEYFQDVNKMVLANKDKLKWWGENILTFNIWKDKQYYEWHSVHL